MTIDEVIKYVTTTPENSNPAVLRSMLEQLEGNSGNNSSEYDTMKVLYTLEGNEIEESADAK